MTIRSTFASLDPVDLGTLERMASSPGSQDLRRQILALDVSSSEDEMEVGPIALSSVSRRPALVVALTVAAVLVIIAGVLVVGETSTPKPTSSTAAKAGTWKLADDVLTGTWQEYTTGPPPGLLACPTPSTCYTMSGEYSSPTEGSPLLSESVYVSTDGGATWAGSPMPQGFASTSPIACGGPSDCAAGGNDNGQSVLATTSDGGQTWEVAPLPSGIGSLRTLSCPSPGVCSGLVADSELQLGTTSATFLTTSDGGKHFTDQAIIAGDSMESLSCSSSLACTAVGWSDASGPNDLTSGVAARTTDGGQTWTSGVLPGGLGVNYMSELACADALHCSMTGTMAVTVANPTTCSPHVGPGQGTTSEVGPTNAQSPAVQAIAQAAGEAAAAQEQKNAESGVQIYSCGPANKTLIIGALASTVDGGSSWSPDPLPINSPEAMFSGLSCPTVTECWATGTDAQPIQVGGVSSSNEPIVVGTIDGGSSWSKVVFSPPQDVPNALATNYLSIGSISCASAGTCVALGTGVQGTAAVPAYSLQSNAPAQ